MGRLLPGDASLQASPHDRARRGTVRRQGERMTAQG